MKELKHIRLYESFESEKLSKTLGFINVDSRKSLIDSLKIICKAIDYPYSELSDDVFEYLLFNSALRKDIKHEMPEPDECKYESDWIPGEFCQGGRVKRTWGSNERMTECPNCNGKGVIYPIVNYDTKLIKFWFSKEGKYIAQTVTDGSDSYDEWSLNKKININRYSNNISAGSIIDKSVLNDAHFAIIMDFKKLKSKEFKKMSVKREERSETKRGILPSNDVIKQENIKRYLDKIVSKYELDKGYKNINKIISVGLSRMPLNFISNSINFDNIESIITNLYFCIKNNKDISEYSDSLKRIYKTKNDKSNSMNFSIDKGKKKFLKSGSDLDKKRFEIWQKWENLNEKLFIKIKEQKCETIADIEILWNKILGLKVVIKSDRYYLNKIVSVISYIISSRDYDLHSEMLDYFREIEDIDKFENDLDVLEKIIDNF